MKALRGILAATLLSSGAAFAAEQSLLGKIDDACAAKPGAVPAADCKGPKYTFTARGKTYTVANPDYPGLAERVQRMAKVTGDVQGDAITIKSIAGSSKGGQK